MNSYKTHLNIALLIGIFLLLTVKLKAQSEFNITTIEGNLLSTTEIKSQIKVIMDSIAMPGLSIAILNDNKIVYSDVFGLANSNTKEIVKHNSIFEGASLSKPIFAYFVMKLVEKGIIDLDEPMYKTLEHPGINKDSTDFYKLITPRMILSHQSGLPNHANGKMIDLAFKPGTDFMYSGEGYQYLLGVIGSKLGVGWELDFNAIFEKEVLQPLKMTETSFVWKEQFNDTKVYGHKNGEPTSNGKGEWSGKSFISYASIHSKADDYAKFIMAMLKHEGLNSEIYSEMLKEQVHFDEENPLRQQVGQTGWGLGFTQKQTDFGTMHMHTGNNHDFQAYCMFIPEQDYGIVVFTNSDKMPMFLEAISKVLGSQF